MKHNRAASLTAFFISALIIAASLWLFLNRQFVIDQFAVWSYKPSADIQSITNTAELTNKGRFAFYATRPALEVQDAFNEACPRQESGSPILGCYTTDDRIYIYNLTNEQLNGMEEVTAVHEMLHAVWARTSQADRETLTTELTAAYERLNDDTLKERMDYYERTEPGEFTNELHSILGTEVASLGEPLETYYTQFFNRTAVLALHDAYNSVYQSLYARADTLYEDMETLAASIKSRSDEYSAAIATYSSDVTSFNQRAASGDFSSQAAFSAERLALTARRTALEAKRAAINKDVDTYNAYYNEYQTIAEQIEGLNKSIDSLSEIDEAPSL